MFYTEGKQPESINNKVKTTVSIQTKFYYFYGTGGSFLKERLIEQKRCKFCQNNKFRIKTRKVTENCSQIRKCYPEIQGEEREREPQITWFHIIEVFLALIKCVAGSQLSRLISFIQVLRMAWNKIYISTILIQGIFSYWNKRKDWLEKCAGAWKWPCTHFFSQNDSNSHSQNQSVWEVWFSMSPGKRNVTWDIVKRALFPSHSCSTVLTCPRAEGKMNHL